MNSTTHASFALICVVNVSSNIVVACRVRSFLQIKMPR